MIPTPTISDKGDWNGGIFLDVHPLNLSGVDDVGCLRGRHRGRQRESEAVGTWERDTARETGGREKGGREGGREGGRGGEKSLGHIVNDLLNQHRLPHPSPSKQTW